MFFIIFRLRSRVCMLNILSIHFCPTIIIRTYTLTKAYCLGFIADRVYIWVSFFPFSGFVIRIQCSGHSKAYMGFHSHYTPSTRAQYLYKRFKSCLLQFSPSTSSSFMFLFSSSMSIFIVFNNYFSISPFPSSSWSLRKRGSFSIFLPHHIVFLHPDSAVDGRAGSR